MVEELFTRPIVIFGCGNVLFGDDGFGPEVIEHLHRHFELPGSAVAIDAGGGVRDLLFDLLLAPSRPRRIAVVDAVSQPERMPGELFELDLDALPLHKISDFSLHQFPSVNMLQELRDVAAVDVRVLAVQAKSIPDRVRPGLSREVADAVPKACAWLLRLIEGTL